MSLQPCLGSVSLKAPAFLGQGLLTMMLLFIARAHKRNVHMRQHTLFYVLYNHKTTQTYHQPRQGRPAIVQSAIVLSRKTV